MRFKLHKIQSDIKKNKELFLLIALILVTVVSTQIYNINKEKINKNYVNLIDNIYFQKNLKHILDNLEPRYVTIEHKVVQGETFDKILNKHQIPKNEIKKVKEILSKKNNLNNLKTDQVIKFTIDKSKNNIVPLMSYNFFSNNTNLFQQYSKSFLVRGKTSILGFKSVESSVKHINLCFRLRFL